MCLYVEFEETTLLAKGTRKARTQHECEECRRTIDPGETYHYWTQVGVDGMEHYKQCSHCQATIVLGAYLTGCPMSWYRQAVFDLDEGYGFVGNILFDEGHDLSRADRLRMLRTVAGQRRQWRWSDGSLMAVPRKAN